MEAHFQIVGCLVASKPADGFIDGFVAQVRRERAVVTAKTARGATFVRFNAHDAALVLMACRAIAGGGSSLRFGFASGVKERALTTQDSLSISNRGIALARELAAAAGKGEVLVSPQLAVGLVEAGFSFQTRDVRLAGGRTVMACALDWSDVALDESEPEGRAAEGRAADAANDLASVPAAAAVGRSAPVPQAPSPAETPRWLPKSAAALGSVFQALLAQAEEIARKQAELEARQDAMLGPAAVPDAASAAVPGIEADLNTQLARLEQRLAAIGRIEERVEQLQRTRAEVEDQLGVQLARRTEVRTLKTLCDTLTAQVADVRGMVDGMATLQQRVEELLRRAGHVEAKIDAVESRHEMVEAVHARANGAANLLDDINVKLEMLTEQRAMVDHVSDKLARLDFALQEAHNTLRALQREREMAERIEQGLKALRARSGLGKSTLPSS